MKMNFLDAIEGNSMNKHPRIIPDSDVDEPLLRAERAVENVLAEACTIIRQRGQVTITEPTVASPRWRWSTRPTAPNGSAAEH